MKKKVKFSNQKAIELLSSEELSNIAKKTKFTLFAEKFLLMSMTRLKIIMQALSKEHAKQQSFIFSLFVLPFNFFLGIYICPYAFLDRLGASATLGKLAFLFCVNIIIATSIKFLFKRKFFLFLSLFFVTIFCYYLLPKSIYAFFLDSQMKRGFIFALTFSYLCFTFLYVFWILVDRINSWLFSKILPNKLVTIGVEFTASHQQELLEYFRKAMEEAAKAQEKDLEILVKSYGKNWDSELKKFIGPVAQKANEITEDQLEEKEALFDKDPSKMMLPIYLGEVVKGAIQKIIVDLIDVVHLLIGGATKMGKTNLLKSIIMQLNKTGKCHFTLLDPAGVTFSKFEHLPNVKYSRKITQATNLLRSIRSEMDKRENLFIKAGVESIDEWKGKKLPYLVVMIDEFHRFARNKQLNEMLVDIACLGRKYGVHLILATQRPDAKLLDEQVRANLPATIAFGVRDKGNARVLEALGAEKIRKKGLAYFVYGADKFLIQTPLADLSALPKRPKSSQTLQIEARNEYKIIPADKEDPKAIFMSKEKLKSKLGGDPELFGFEKTRSRVDGDQKRGFWVKEKEKGKAHLNAENAVVPLGNQKNKNPI